MQLKFLILAGAMCMPAALLAQAAPTTDAASQPARPVFDKADAEQAVTDLATALEENFVFPEKGKAYATMLRANLAKGAYASFPDAPAFAEKVTVSASTTVITSVAVAFFPSGVVAVVLTVHLFPSWAHVASPNPPFAWNDHERTFLAAASQPSRSSDGSASATPACCMRSSAGPNGSPRSMKARPVSSSCATSAACRSRKPPTRWASPPPR